MIKPLPYLPVQGKTYTLFGESDHTRGFYLAAHTLADECLERENDIKAWLETIRGYSHKRKVLKRMAGKPTDDTRLSWCLHRSKDVFTPYTRAVDKHLESLTMKKLWDRRLGTTREQYFLHMLEIMLTNRSNKDAFLDCDQKIALLPYCLQDFSTSCQAAPDQYDYRCKHCSKNCYQNQVTRILEQHGVEPYIWMEADFKKLYGELKKHGKSLGILGVACVPELANGIHECSRYNIPVVGIPLDANRCIRWWGEFFPNSVNLEELEKLVTAS